MAEIETAASKNDLSGYLDADRRFHIKLVEPLRNRRLARAARAMAGPDASLGADTPRPGGLATGDRVRAQGYLSAAATGGKRVEVERSIREHLCATRAASGLASRAPSLGADHMNEPFPEAAREEPDECVAPFLMSSFEG